MLALNPVGAKISSHLYTAHALLSDFLCETTLLSSRGPTYARPRSSLVSASFVFLRSSTSSLLYVYVYYDLSSMAAFVVVKYRYFLCFFVFVQYL